MPIEDRKDGIPVFDINSKAYKSRRKLELNFETIDIFWNNGLAPHKVRYGTLSVEWNNLLIKQLCILMYFNVF